MSGYGEVTLLLRALREGDDGAFDRLIPLVHDELRTIARAHLRRRGRPGTLDTHGLVHEAYLKMAGAADLDVRDRGHLLAVAARAMRQVLVDLARARLAAKRGAAAVPITLEEERLPGSGGHVERLLDLDRALDRLAREEPRLAKVVECRYFAGLSEEETAAALSTSLRTAQREWLRARAWLRREIEEVGA